MSDGEFKDAIDFAPVGQDQDTLEEYGLSQEIIIKAAERMQKMTGTFRSRDASNMEPFFKSLIDDPGKRDKSDYIYFNVPICDLDALDNINFDDDSFCKKFDTSLEGTRSCITLLAARECAAQMTLNGSKWPYYFTSNSDRKES